MKKIGVVTFHRALNYGAVLQAYALVKYINLHCDGLEAEIIDYRNSRIEKANKVIGKKWYLSPLNLFRLGKKFINNSQIYFSRTHFDKFISKYIPHTQRTYTKEDIQLVNSKFDLFICGSDQIWNLELTQNDANYFLEFSQKRNIAYAASFGITDINELQKEKYDKYLRNLTYISVREYSGQRIVEHVLKIEVPIVMDPVFLLNRNEWRDLFRLNNPIGVKYLLIYVLVETPEIIMLAKKIAKSKNLKIISISNCRKVVKSITKLANISPERWLQLFEGADVVVTNSFHGIAFSLNFERDFYVNLLPNNMSKVNSRIIDILDKFGIQERVCDLNNWEKIKPIDYKKINSLKEEEVRFSQEYVKNVCWESR